MSRKVPPFTMAPERASALAEAAAVSGVRWARAERELLHAEGRRAEGGWPGTLSQARNYVRFALPDASQSLSHEELSWMARAIYASARRDWLASSDPPSLDEG